MTLSDVARRVEKLVVDNSPAIMTSIGVAGVLTTAYLTGRATFKAAEILRKEQEEFDQIVAEQLPDFNTDELEPKEKIALVWKLYIPPTVTAVVALAAIICANRVGSRRAAALAAAYTISEKAFDEYRTKIVEKMGAKREEAARAEIAKDRLDRLPPEESQVLGTFGGSHLCYEAFTGRYFLSDLETLRKAENDINHEVIHDSFASLSDLYDSIGLPHTSMSDEVGWNLDKLLELHFVPVLTDTGKPCISVEFTVAPIRHYNRLM